MLKEVLERFVDASVIPEREGPECYRPLVVDGTKQVLLDVVVDDRTQMRSIQVVLNKTLLGSPFIERTMRHLSAVRQRIAIRDQVEIKEAGLTGSKETALIPLRDVMIAPGLLICHALTWFVFLHGLLHNVALRLRRIELQQPIFDNSEGVEQVLASCCAEAVVSIIPHVFCSYEYFLHVSLIRVVEVIDTPREWYKARTRSETFYPLAYLGNGVAVILGSSNCIYTINC